MNITWFVAALVLIGLIIALVIYGYYASMINQKCKLDEAQGGVEVQLKKRQDLIPNLVTVVEKYMKHERTIMTLIANYRTRVESENQSVLPHENATALLLTHVQEIIEQYPELQSEHEMNAVLQTVLYLESEIAAARENYNSMATSFNIALETFPQSLIRRALKLHRYPLFNIDEGALSNET
ncbi:MAG: LemA family protein [Bdellovibrionales bacterium]|nr:LemA family protein [Bdellovibrionales bacterium]